MIRRATLAATAFLAACGGQGTVEDADEGWHPDPEPEPGDVRLVVAAAEPQVPLGGDVVFRVKVENAGKVAARVPASADDDALAKALADACAAHRAPTKDVREHIRAGRQKGVHWETEVPVTDPHDRGR